MRRRRKAHTHTTLEKMIVFTVHRVQLKVKVNGTNSFLPVDGCFFCVFFLFRRERVNESQSL